MTVGKPGRRPAKTDPNRLLNVKQQLANAAAAQSFPGAKPPLLRSYSKLIARVNEGWKKFYPAQTDEFAVGITESNEDGAGAFEVFYKREGSSPLSVDDLSAGQLELFLFLAALVLNDDHEGIVFIDEPELHLDPQWHALSDFRVIDAHLQPNRQDIIASQDALADGISDAAMSYTDPGCNFYLVLHAISRLGKIRDRAVLLPAAHPCSPPRGFIHPERASRRRAGRSLRLSTVGARPSRVVLAPGPGPSRTGTHRRLPRSCSLKAVRRWVAQRTVAAGSRPWHERPRSGGRRRLDLREYAPRSIATPGRPAPARIGPCLHLDGVVDVRRDPRAGIRRPDEPPGGRRSIAPGYSSLMPSSSEDAKARGARRSSMEIVRRADRRHREPWGPEAGELQV